MPKAVKHCPAGHPSHARVATCKECGHVFYHKKSELPAAVVSDAPKAAKKSVPVAKVEGTEAKENVFNSGKVIAPAGLCPVELKDFSPEGLQAWAEKVEEKMNERGQSLSNEAFQYWARKYYSFWKDEEKEKAVKKAFPVEIVGI